MKGGGEEDGLSKYCPDCFSLHPHSPLKSHHSAPKESILIQHLAVFFVNRNFSDYSLPRGIKVINSALCGELAVGWWSEKPFANNALAFLHA